MKILSKLDNTEMIEETADKRFVTDAEKLTWNGKADKTYVDSQDALKADKTAVEVSLELKADKAYVDNKVKTDVPVGAKFTDTVYTHPTSHPASMITESSTKRFVSDTEKSTWNSKADTDTVTTINGKTGAISKADIVALGIPASDTNTTYSEITTAEIDAGTASTLRTITARRLKYLLDKIVALFPTKTSELTNDSGFLTRWPTWSEVTGKPSTFAPSTHSHAWADVTDKPTTATRWPTWEEIITRPTTFPPSSHTHAWSTITSKPDVVNSSGSNTNGGYIKFTDGTQICWRNYTISNVSATAVSGALYVSANYNWTFPATFSENPSISGLCNPSGGASVFVAGVSIASTSVVSFRIASLQSSTITAVRTTLMAIGRWK